MLAHALDWTTQPASGPQLSLHMSRDKAIVASRVDMDQAMETADVHPATGPGIYDKLLPILAQWKQAYNFVGSYYIDIGNNAAQGQTTDWAYSKPYYDQMLAMGNEIGSHSYTHPEDTNLLTPAQIQFEFQQSRQVIEQQLGLTNIGVAVPGAPETIDTAQQIAQYYPYISGGASLIGAGYPGAIGYLTPGDMNSVYIAPNTSFDFTLVGFQKLTAEQAEAAWAKEWAALTAHSDLPVIVWPWHDYGATNWPIDENTPPAYTTQMFTNFIARAAQAGSEFVTLADLARRVSSFEKSTLSLQLRRGGECRHGDRRHHRQPASAPSRWTWGRAARSRAWRTGTPTTATASSWPRPAAASRSRSAPPRTTSPTSPICRTGRNCSA